MATETAALSLVLFLIFIVFLVVALAIFLTVFWVLMLVDCAKRNFKNENEKVVWIVVLALTSWIGAIIYYFVVKRKVGDKKSPRKFISK
jgi:uncharacterized BrkB/YihY/UPF0761 family membrane protein